MNEAAKKIWVKAQLSGLLHAGYTDYMGGNEYIRADLVDGLVEALQSIAREPSEQSLEYGAKSLRDKARAALKAMEEEQ